MSSLDQSMMDIMIGLHEYNQLLSIRDDYSRQAIELQQKTKQYQHLQNIFSNLFEQNKVLEKETKKISIASLNWSSKMLECEQKYIKVIKNMEDEMGKLKAQNQLLNKQLVPLKQSDKKYQELWRQLAQTSIPDISNTSIQKQHADFHNSGQSNTQKIQINHEQVSQLFSTQPTKKKQQKQNKPSKEQFFISSQSSIYSKKIADKIRNLETELQATKKKLAQQAKINEELKESSGYKQSISSEISQNSYQSKYKKLKIAHASMKVKLQNSKQDLRKLTALCQGINISKQ